MRIYFQDRPLRVGPGLCPHFRGDVEPCAPALRRRLHADFAANPGRIASGGAFGMGYFSQKIQIDSPRSVSVTSRRPEESRRVDLSENIFEAFGCLTANRYRELVGTT